MPALSALLRPRSRTVHADDQSPASRALLPSGSFPKEHTVSRDVGIGGNELKSEGLGLISELGFHPQTRLLFQLREDAFVISLMGR